MIRRSTWIILGFFLSLLAGSFIFRVKGGFKDTPLEQTPQANKVFNIQDREIVELVISDKNDRNLLLQAGENGLLMMIVPLGKETDTQVVNNLLSQLRSLEKIASIPNQSGNLTDFGLDPWHYKFSILLTDRQSVELFIGEITPTGSGYFGLIPGGDVMVLPKVSIDNLVHYLDEPPILLEPTAQPTRFDTGK